MAAVGFFDRQNQARRHTRSLVMLFVLAVAGVIAGVNAVVVLAVHGEELAETSNRAVFLPTIGMTTALLLLLIGGAMLLRMSQLSKGGSAVAEALGGTRVDDDTRDPQLRQLRNVVEEMAIASGVPAPAVFVLENEHALNAFAAGHTPSDAAVAVTRGSLDRFSRDELQAVIAHEFSHILNGDMRLNIRLMGWLFGILVLTIVGRKILHSTRYSRGGRDRGSALAIGLALVIVGYIGVFFGHLIKAAVSRSREILADASAVQFTRNSSALAGALKKIAGVPAGSLLQDPEVEEVSHMLFAQGLRARLFATHPPLLERISALEPGFNARAFATESATLAERFDGIPVANLAGNSAGDAAFANTSTQPTGALQDATPSVAVPSFDYQAPSSDPTELLASIGALREHPLRMARQLRDAIPESLLRPAHSPGGAVPVLLGLLLDADAHIQARQRAGIVRHLGEAIAAQALRVYPDCARLHPLQRSPLAAIALPAVRRLPLQQLCGLRDVVPELIHADAHVDIHEYVIGAMLEAQLDDALHPGRAQVDPRLTLPTLADDVGLLLAVMAHAGHESSHARKMALSAGQARLPPDARIDVALDDWHLHLDGSLRRLDALSPARKRVLVEALMATMQHDHHINAREYELLCAVCAALHCPLPALGLAVG